MDNVKIVFAGRYNGNEILSGPEKVARRIFDAHSLKEKCFFLEYYFDGKKSGLMKKLFGFETVKNVNGSFVIRAGLFRIFFELWKIKPGIIHIITFERFALVCLLYGILRKVKIILNLHGFVSYENDKLRNVPCFLKWKDRRTEKFLIRYSDRIIVNSLIAKKMFTEKLSVPESKFVVIPNGVDLVFTGGRIEEKVSEREKMKIVFTGDADRKEKGFEFLLSALQEIKFESELYVTGSNDELSYINDNPHLQIFFSEKKAPFELAVFYSDKDVIVCPGFYELFSISTAEGICAGLVPVISSKAGISEFIDDGINGFVFDYGDTTQLADIFSKLYGDITLRKNISDNAAMLYGRLNWDEIYRGYEKLYKSLQS